jgi:hypothetical protein
MRGLVSGGHQRGHGVLAGLDVLAGALAGCGVSQRGACAAPV